MRARSVTGSLFSGSSHRLVRNCLCSAVLSLRWVGSAVVPQCRHLQVAVGRSTPDICSLNWTVRLEIYLLLPRVSVFLIIYCCFFRIFWVRDMATDKLTNSEQTGPLPGTFLGPCLDIRSERLYDFTPDIQDAMELRALRPSAELVKTMSVRDSKSIRIVTPDVHVECGFQGFLFREMREDESLCVATGELDYLRGDWPRVLLALMTQYRRNFESKQRECKERFSYTHSGNCEHCGKLLLTDFDKHISFCHLELAWICCCLVMWCQMWRWTTQD